MSISEKSNNANTPAVKGENTGTGGFGVLGICATGHGVHGQSTTSKGVVGESEGFHGVFGKSRDNAGVAAESQNTEAMNAQNHSANHAAIIAINHANGVGVQGRSGGNVGVLGESDTGRGIMGTSNTHIGVSGDSQLGQGVRGTSVRGRGTEGFSINLEGVVGTSKQSTGVLGVAEGSGSGVLGQSNQGSGVVATSSNGQGLTVFSDNDIGIFSQGATFSGVFNGAFVVNKGPNPKDPTKSPSDINGSIVINDGNLFVNKGDIILTGADCAEEFDIVGVENIESGTVMIINEEGALRISDQPYDKKVAGVISGAGDYKPGLILDRQQSPNDRKPIALIGKVYCKADAQHGAIEVGDLLTTSPTSGHAMKAIDPLKAFGAIIGKALRPLKEGQGLIPILVSLQ